MFKEEPKRLDPIKMCDAFRVGAITNEDFDPTAHRVPAYARVTITCARRRSRKWRPKTGRSYRQGLRLWEWDAVPGAESSVTQRARSLKF
jgi:hypothetical protein